MKLKSLCVAKEIVSSEETVFRISHGDSRSHLSSGNPATVTLAGKQSSEVRNEAEAPLIKRQRGKSGFITSHCLLPEPQSESSNLASRNLEMRLRLSAVSSCLKIFSKAGTKGLYHWD